MTAFIDQHKDRFGVEPICATLQIAPSTSYYAAKARPPSARAGRDETLKTEIRRVYDANYQVYGARKIWRQLHREGIQAARCTVERGMRELASVVWCVASPNPPRPVSKLPSVRTTWSSATSLPAGPTGVWVADLSYVRTWVGFVYAAFVVDVFSRMIVGWQLATHLRTDLALDALQTALWRCGAAVEGWCITAIGAVSTPLSATPSGSPKPASPRRSAPKVTVTTMP
jgi:putative transposase